MENTEIHTMLGRLSAQHEETRNMIAAVLRNQETARSEFRQHEGRDDGRFEKTEERFDRVDAGLGDLRERVRGVEEIADMVSIHETTFGDIERRLSDGESFSKVAQETMTDLKERVAKQERQNAVETAREDGVRATNRRWLGAAGAAGTVAGAVGHGIWPRLWKFLVAWMGGK